MFKIYSIEEWFNEFYPKSWGNWREFYNIKKYREQKNLTGCTWMDYSGYAVVSGETDEKGHMKVLYCLNEFNKKYTIDNFFISCAPYFVQPYYQPKDKEYYVKVKAYKMESNLDLYCVYISGCDDSSYTKHFIGLSNLMNELKYIKENGILDIQDREYFFTN